jgi:hypothetical protein
MDHKKGEESPSVYVNQLESMIAFADARDDFVLAAWLSEANERIKTSHMNDPSS